MNIVEDSNHMLVSSTRLFHMIFLCAKSLDTFERHLFAVLFTLNLFAVLFTLNLLGMPSAGPAQHTMK